MELDLETKRPGLAWAGIVFGMAFPTLATLGYFVWTASFPAVVQQLVYTAAKGIQFAFPIVWVLCVLREPVGRPWALSGTAPGAAFGALVLAAGLLVYHTWLRTTPFLDAAAAAVQAKVLGFGADTLAKYVLLAAFYSLAHSFLEEYYWRWFVFGRLRRRLALGPAILVSSLAFASHHVVLLSVFFGPQSWVTVLCSLAVVAGGAFWAWLYAREGSILGPWLSHLLVDAAIFVIGYDLLRNRL